MLGIWHTTVESHSVCQSVFKNRGLRGKKGKEEGGGRERRKEKKGKKRKEERKNKKNRESSVLLFSVHLL